MSLEAENATYSRDRSHRVFIFRRPDGTFGFEDQKYSSDSNEQCWLPVGRYSDSRTPSAEDALREAIGRVAWLSAERTGGVEYRLHRDTIGSPPPAISGLPVVCFSPIDGRHHPTGATHLSAGGADVSTPEGVVICRESETSYYLFYCDVRWKPMTDTWHESVKAAKAQAEFEFEGVGETWETSA